MSAATDAPLRLVAITEANYEATLALRVRPEQEGFVAPVLRSLADAYVHGATALAAEVEGVVVGMALVFVDDAAGGRRAIIARLLIDRSRQGQGLGRALTAAVLDWFRAQDPPAVEVAISAVPENARAIALYEALGFARTGEIADGEVVLRRRL